MSLLSDLLKVNLSETTEKVIAEYIWIGGSGMDLRSTARAIPGPVTDPSKLPKWNYDGSSTGQAPGEDSEAILYPQAIFRDPFRRGKNILVICDAYTPAGEPIPTNKRHSAAKIFSHPDVVAEEPWYGIEQEYTLLQKDVTWPLGWPVGGFPGPQGPYYCGAGADKAFGLDIVDAHYKACLYAGINISGINGEVMPGQWEFQVGPAVGISAGDELWCARYILERICEIAGVVVSFDPKPIPGDWNGAGAHINYSTKSLRNVRGYEHAVIAADKLEMKSALLGELGAEFQILRYKADGEVKLSGFVIDAKMHPSHDEMDPYKITSRFAETVLWKPTIREVLIAKSYTDPFLRAVRSAWDMLKRLVTCSSS